jgi:hypothetical protein
MNDFEKLMSSYGLDASNPDHLDELLFRIENENETAIYNPDDLESLLSDYDCIDDFYDEYSEDED